MATSFNSRLSTAPEEGCKAPCVTVSLTNITLSGEQTIGVTAIVSGDRVLVAGQTNSAENGIYNANTSSWTRAKDWNTAEDVIAGMLIPVSATEELYQTKPFTGAYNPGVTAVTFGVGILSARSVETQLGSQAVSRVFTLTTTTYTPGANNLEVDQNGQRLNITADYTEPSASTILIDASRTINANDTFTFRTNTTVSNSVTTTTAISHTRGGVAHNLATYLDGFVMEFDTMALAIASTKVYEGAVLLIKDRANSHWDVVLSSGVTENTYNIVQGVGVGTLSFVLRVESTMDAKAFGAIGDNSTSNTAVVEAADGNCSILLFPSPSGEIYRFSTTPTLSNLTCLFDTESACSNRTLNQLNGYAIGSGLISGAVRCDDLRGKNIEVLCGTIRQNATTRTQWDWIQDANHEPVGFDDSAPCTASGSIITVPYTKTYTKVLTLIAGPDETLANALNMSVGASSGISSLELQAGISVALCAYIYYDGAAWQVDYGPGQGGTGFNNIEITAVAWEGADNIVRVTHQYLPGYDISIVPYQDGPGGTPAYVPYVVSTTKTPGLTYSTRIGFVNMTTPGAFVAAVDTRMKFILSKRYSEGIPLDGTNGSDILDLSRGNIWMFGLMQL